MNPFFLFIPTFVTRKKKKEKKNKTTAQDGDLTDGAVEQVQL